MIGRRTVGVETSRMCERHPAKCFSLGSRARAIYSTGTCRRTVPLLFPSPSPPLPRILTLSLSLVSSLANTDAGSYPVTCPRRHGKCRSNSSTSARLIGQVCRHDVRVPFPSLPSPSFPRLASKFHGTRAIRAPPPFDSSSTVARPCPRSRSFVGGCWSILLLLLLSKRRREFVTKTRVEERFRVYTGEQVSSLNSWIIIRDEK